MRNIQLLEIAPRASIEIPPRTLTPLTNSRGLSGYPLCSEIIERGVIIAPSICINAVDCVVTHSNWFLTTSFTPPEQSALFPRYYWHTIIAKSYDFALIRELSTDQLNVPESIMPFVFLQPNCINYGHFLLEALPRLILAAHVAKKQGLRMHPLVHETSPSFVFQFIKLVPGLAEAIIIPKGKYFLGRCLAMSSVGALEYAYHPLIAEVIREFTKEISSLHEFSQDVMPATNSSKLLLTRDGTISKTQRETMRAEKEIGNYLRDHKFHIFAPQKEPAMTQIKAFYRSEIIISQYCSALHNTIFSASGARILSLGCDNEVQALICLSMQQRLFVAEQPLCLEAFKANYRSFIAECD